jgi:hypothetical protein
MSELTSVLVLIVALGIWLLALRLSFDIYYPEMKKL